MAQVLSLNAGEGAVALMVVDEILQGLLTGDEGCLKHIVQHIDLGTNALGFGIGKLAVYVDKDFAGLVQILHHDIQIVGQDGEAAHDHKTCHRNAHGSEGHKAMGKNMPQAFLQKISNIIKSHCCNNPPFRR